MDMTQLTRIYNTLLLIRTSGEDTIIMGDCLKALKDWIQEAKTNAPAEETTSEEE
jgi:hypothetical protein